MRIDVYLSPSCSHQDAIRQTVSEALSEAGETAEPNYVSVSGSEQAKDLKSLGSPTVRINGFDAEYAEREPEEYSAGCRYYNSVEGWKPNLRKEMLVRAITVARAREQRQGAS
ncbi:MAG: hypothetical protein ACR2PL_15335 [Dehalococcoidia bacterium]